MAGTTPRESGGVDVAPYAAFGYDWALGGFTLGVVADIDMTGTDNSDMLSAGKGAYAESDWFATLRGRVGVAATEKVHVYASGGIAVLSAQSTSVDLFRGAVAVGLAKPVGNRCRPGSGIQSGSEAQPVGRVPARRV
jgi:opacity protein-like surface antigen